MFGGIGEFRMNKLVVVVAFAAIALGASASSAQTPIWKAIAFSNVDGHWGWAAVPNLSRDEVGARAVDSCRQGGGQACAVAGASQRCISLATNAQNGGFSAAGATEVEAKAAALDGCVRTWGLTCQVQVTRC